MVGVSPAGLVYLFPAMFAVKHRPGFSFNRFQDPLSPGDFYDAAGLREAMILSTILSLRRDGVIKLEIGEKERKRFFPFSSSSKESRLLIVKVKNFERKSYGFLSMPVAEVRAGEKISLAYFTAKNLKNKSSPSEMFKRVYIEDLKPLSLFKEEKSFFRTTLRPLKEKVIGFSHLAAVISGEIKNFEREEPEMFRIALMEILKGIIEWRKALKERKEP